MLSINDRSEIITLIKQEVTTAIGCTEPIAVALAVAKATELLETGHKFISEQVSSFQIFFHPKKVF